jgi:hypothetical protein
VFGSLGPVKVEFFFEKLINGNVQAEGVSRRSTDTEPAIHIKAAWTLSKEVNFAAAQFEGLKRARGIDVF